jgi:hypothetical protein
LSLHIFQPILGRLDQPNVARWLRQDAVVIVSKLRTLEPVAKSLEVGEPEQVADFEPEPVSQRAGGFNRRNIPAHSRPDRLHALRLVQPFRHPQLVEILRAGASETLVP